MDNHIITRTTATRIISLLDWVYHEGVEQAREMDDEGMCREFIDTHRKVGVLDSWRMALILAVLNGN